MKKEIFLDDWEESQAYYDYWQEPNRKCVIHGNNYPCTTVDFEEVKTDLDESNIQSNR